jgi:hypothetical protein
MLVSAGMEASAEVSFASGPKVTIEEPVGSFDVGRGD